MDCNSIFRKFFHSYYNEEDYNEFLTIFDDDMIAFISEYLETEILEKEIPFDNETISDLGLVINSYFDEQKQITNEIINKLLIAIKKKSLEGLFQSKNSEKEIQKKNGNNNEKEIEIEIENENENEKEKEKEKEKGIKSLKKDLSQIRINNNNNNKSKKQKKKKKKKLYDPFQVLPDELIFEVLEYLTQKELFKFSFVSKLWYSFCFDPSLWYKLNLNYLPKIDEKILKKIHMLSRGYLTELKCYNNFTQVSGPVFQKFIKRNPSLVHLQIGTNVKLRADELTALVKFCPQLQVVKIFRCPKMVTNTSIRAFAQLQNLKHLELVQNGLTHLSKSITQITTLTTLRVTRNLGMQVLPAKIGNLANLKELNLRGNGLFSLPQSFTRLQSLTKLKLNNNQFAKMPEEAFDCKKLTNFNISGNEVHQCPAEINRIGQSLTKLNLSNNRMELFQFSRMKFPFLKSINLSYNSLPNIIEIQSLGSVVSLKLSHTHFETIPREIQGLQNLKVLEMNTCSLNELPEQICKLKNLECLDVKNNFLQKLPKHFYALKKLKVLKIGTNSFPDRATLEVFDNLLQVDVLWALETFELPSAYKFYQKSTVKLTIKELKRQKENARYFYYGGYY
ncbi:leucine-rich repeat-containing [Anaeramoeba flamelloides]|uniref:Leucine-rich repeat-containing n=1 Tax=Anaeramoeba flamelloides TaxID=1746091 RepID=A0ABQ8YRH0_9EUKA|nr:leucine-rich repeat-containing [Anaeramoeba flamelloides]